MVAWPNSNGIGVVTVADELAAESYPRSSGRAERLRYVRLAAQTHADRRGRQAEQVRRGVAAGHSTHPRLTYDLRPARLRLRQAQGRRRARRRSGLLAAIVRGRPRSVHPLLGDGGGRRRLFLLLPPAGGRGYTGVGLRRGSGHAAGSVPAGQPAGHAGLGAVSTAGAVRRADLSLRHRADGKGRRARCADHRADQPLAA